MKIKAYLIDPFKKTFTEHEIEQGDIQDIYDLIDCRCFTVFDNKDLPTASFYIDDEGLWNENRAWWRIAGYPDPITGKALVVGTDDEGRSQTPHFGIDVLHRRVKWIDLLKINGTVREFPR